MSATPIERRYVMACTEVDYHRLLGAAIGPCAFDPASHTFSHVEADRSWSMALGEVGERRIAQWHIALTEVTFRFCGYEPAEVERVLQRFFAYFQRGGG